MAQSAVQEVETAGTRAVSGVQAGVRLLGIDALRGLAIVVMAR